MKALILNSGTGSRMGDITRTHPKCMTEIGGGETILSRQLRLLSEAGVRDMVITTGSWDEAIRTAVKDQGLDIRCMNDDDIEDINRMKIVKMHFAWDNPQDDLEGKFRTFAERHRKSRHGMVYCLTNFNSTMEENLYRIYTLRSLNYDPYVMIYNKPEAPKEIKRLQRWCNSKWIFKSCPRFEDYKR